ncbi:MAG: hypothetical protein VX938_06915 [Myxococcota bacterium]|nr:hypothetical protein [Myxococcota bacterium]
MTTRHGFTGILLTTFVSLTLICGTAAAEDKDSPSMAHFDVQVIHASRAEGPADPALKPLSQYLTKSFKRYKSFKRLDQITLVSSRGTAAKGKLPDKKTLSLKYVESEKGFVKVALELDGLKTTVRVRDGGLFFQAGRLYKDGILVLAIEAKTGK